jgi:hypothetical protein
MRVTVGYTLAGSDPVTVSCGYQAQAAVEKKYDMALSSMLNDGMKQEAWAYMAWTQAVKDKLTEFSFTAFADALDDLDLTVGQDPSGQVPAQQREPS